MSSTTEGVTPTVNDGSGGGLIAFLGWAIDRNELVDSTASALRTGCVKVLSAEPGWEEVDLRSADLDSIVDRFKIKHRMDMKDRTREQYEQRFRQSVEMYFKWLDHDPSWKPAQRRRAASTNSGSNKKATPPDSSGPLRLDAPPEQSSQVGMITYPFPIRPGLRGKIELPEDLSPREASRVASFIATLAVEHGPGTVAPLAIASGKEPGGGGES